MNPLISIIVPCYNQAQFLDECLQSVLEQTYFNWECLITNDGSSDNTESLAQEWLKKDSRFKYIYKENGGLSQTRNLGIEKSQGTIILPVDCDDKIGSKYLELAVEKFKENPDLSLVYCQAERFGVIKEKWLLPDFSLANLSKGNMIFCSAFFKRSEWKLVGGFDEKMLYGWEDWEFWISILKNGGQVFKLEYTGFYYRIRKKSMLSSIDNKKAVYLKKYLSVKHADFFVEYYGAFMEMRDKIFYKEFEFKEKLRSKKFVVNLFFKTFFKINLFSKYRNE